MITFISINNQQYSQSDSFYIIKVEALAISKNHS